MINANRINPARQNPKHGDTVYYGKGMAYGLLSLIKTNEYFSIQGWTFFLQPVDNTNTRLIIRFHSMEVRQSIVGRVYYYLQFESLHFIMESGMMMWIKERAERYEKK